MPQGPEKLPGLSELQSKRTSPPSTIARHGPPHWQNCDRNTAQFALQQEAGKPGAEHRTRKNKGARDAEPDKEKSLRRLRCPSKSAAPSLRTKACGFAGHG
jgi:hypothetical protein